MNDVLQFINGISPYLAFVVAYVELHREKNQGEAHFWALFGIFLMLSNGTV